MNIKRNRDNLLPIKEKKQRPRWLATPALHFFMSTCWIIKCTGRGISDTLVFIGGLVKLEKVRNLMLLLDVAGEAQVRKVKLPRSSAQIK